MANSGVSQHFKIDGGLDLSSDSQFATLGANTKIVYKPSGEKYIKNPNYSNVFDKTDTFGDLEADIKSKAVNRIVNSGNPDGATNYYSIDGTFLGSFKSGVSPKDLSDGLGDVKSTSISAIDDANASGVCSCKNTSGAQIDTFTCHIPVSNHNSSLAWGQQATIGYVDGKVLTINMPGNPNTDTKYWAGTGLELKGTTFYIDENWLKTFIKNNGGSMNYGDERTLYSIDGEYSVGEIVGGSNLYTNPGHSGDNFYEWPSGSQSGTWVVTRAAQEIHRIRSTHGSGYAAYTTVWIIYSLRAKQMLL